MTTCYLLTHPGTYCSEHRQVKAKPLPQTILPVRVLSILCSLKDLTILRFPFLAAEAHEALGSIENQQLTALSLEAPFLKPIHPAYYSF